MSQRLSRFLLLVMITMVSGVVQGHDDGNHQFQIIDPGYTITSDFGPRFTSGSLFHKAIDYRRATGQTTPLLADGVITDLDKGGSQILRFTVDSTQNNVTHRYRYYHMFNNNNELAAPVCSGGFMLTQHDGAAIGGDDSRVIIKLTAGTTNRADYMLSRNPGETVTVNFNTTPSASCANLGYTGVFTFQTQDTDAMGNPLVDQNGNPVLVNALTEDTINRTDHEFVGPSGNSGVFSNGNAYPPHMHIEMAPAGTGFVSFAYSENPLFHMPDRASDYVIRVLDKDSNPRLEGYVVGPEDSDSSFLRIELDGRGANQQLDATDALDLEELNLYVDTAVVANRIRQFKMGGNTTANDRVNLSDAEIDTANTESDANGMRPLRSGNEGVVGYERYVYNDWESAGTTVSPTNLSEGAHDLVIDIVDIHENSFSRTFQFHVDRTAPTSSLTVNQN